MVAEERSRTCRTATGTAPGSERAARGKRRGCYPTPSRTGYAHAHKVPAAQHDTIRAK